MLSTNVLHIMEITDVPKIKPLLQCFAQLRHAHLPVMSAFLSASKFSCVSVSNFLLSAKDPQLNAFGAKIEVPSKVKMNKWDAYLTGYDDKVYVISFSMIGPLIILSFRNQTYQSETTHHLCNTKPLWTISLHQAGPNKTGYNSKTNSSISIL